MKNTETTNEGILFSPYDLTPNEASKIEIFGARAHNLKNINLSIPRNQLVVITGLSGSGKSSLAFDTIFAEGQRRYIETFSSYARQFLSTLTRPEVDKISGLSPVISIEQKTVSKSPRSTVGTITEIYDFYRLLFARIADAHSPTTGQRMIKYVEKEIIELIEKKFNNHKISLLAPLIKGRKGHYKELFEKCLKEGYTKVRIDGVITDIVPGLKLDRYKIHDIELVVDRVIAKSGDKRLKEAIRTCLKKGNNSLLVLDFESEKTHHFSKSLMCPDTGFSLQEPEPNSFSFNSPKGACKNCSGLGEIVEIDMDKIIPDPKASIKKGGLAPLGKFEKNWVTDQIESILNTEKFKIDTPIKDISENILNTILYGTQETIPASPNFVPVYGFEGIINILSRYQQESNSKTTQKWADSFTNKLKCPTCEGSRLNSDAKLFKINGSTIVDLVQLDLEELLKWSLGILDHITERQQLIGKELIKEINSRTKFLVDIGLSYLTLNLGAKALSGGEAQRIRLATQIGSQLTGVLYILDEPSIGLHQRDNHKLIDSLKKLRDEGNSVLVVEHDKDIMLEADYLIDIGPGAGTLGGQIVSQCPIDKLGNIKSLTTDYLTGRRSIEPNFNPRKGNGKMLFLSGAEGNNLKNIDVNFPLGKFIAVTGVSGSGKSTLINETLYPILSQYLYKSIKNPLTYQNITGLDNVDKVIEIDQTPIGRTPRSNPATYSGMFSEIRNLFASLPEAKIRGYAAGRFSFNVKGGRCEICKGAGLKTVEMNFLPDVYIECDSCFGKRYNFETLEVRYKGKSINDVLNLPIREAFNFFEAFPAIARKLQTLLDVGLDYITLGQPSTTLSGGEAQRVKLATELSKKQTGNTCYILDEPTTGLHFQDIEALLKVLNRLTDEGNTIIVIEHNMDIIKSADYIIDMGPEGGKYGGQIVATGNVKQIAENPGATGQYLKKEIENWQRKDIS